MSQIFSNKCLLNILIFSMLKDGIFHVARMTATKQWMKIVISYAALKTNINNDLVEYIKKIREHYHS